MGRGPEATPAQALNLRHVFVGHLFQCRYKAILVQKATHLKEFARYIVLNPVIRPAGGASWGPRTSRVAPTKPGTGYAVQTVGAFVRFGLTQ